MPARDIMPLLRLVRWHSRAPNAAALTQSDENENPGFAARLTQHNGWRRMFPYAAANRDFV